MEMKTIGSLRYRMIIDLSRYKYNKKKESNMSKFKDFMVEGKGKRTIFSPSETWLYDCC